MIQALRDRYAGASVAVLGSGPSLSLYDEREDVAIAVNGAALTHKRYDLFFAGDRASPGRQWWEASLSRDVPRVISSYIAPFDPALYPCARTRERLQGDLERFAACAQGDHGYAHFVPDTLPQSPHLFFRFGGFMHEAHAKVSRDQDAMLYGGTISAIAVQGALVMGAREIHLYGCGFDNGNGMNYAYACPPEQAGATRDDQAAAMQNVIDGVRDQGIPVRVHGPSRLR